MPLEDALVASRRIAALASRGRLERRRGCGTERGGEKVVRGKARGRMRRSIGVRWGWGSLLAVMGLVYTAGRAAIDQGGVQLSSSENQVCAFRRVTLCHFGSFSTCNLPSNISRELTHHSPTPIPSCFTAKVTSIPTRRTVRCTHSLR